MVNKNIDLRDQTMAKKMISQEHDKFFRKVLLNSHTIRAFLKNYLPKKVLNEIDLEKLDCCLTSFVSDVNRSHIADIVLKSRFISMPNKEIYFLIEHQSGVDRKMALRFLEYTAQIMNLHLKQHRGYEVPLVYQMLFYTGSRAYNYPLSIRESTSAPKGLLEYNYEHSSQLIELEKVNRLALAEEDIVSHMRKNVPIGALKQLILSMEKFLSVGEYEYVLKYLLRNKIETKDALRELRESAMIGANVMTIVREMEKAQFKRGIKQGKKQVALGLLKEIKDRALISKVTGLSQSELKAMLKEK